MATARQKDTALARAVQEIPALAVLREQWQQRPGESSEDYWSMMDWIDRGAKRGAPPDAHRTLAARNDWAERCAAYDRAAELAQRHNTSGRDAGQRITDNIMLACELASAKLARQEASSDALVMTVKDLHNMMSLLRQIQKEVVDAQLSATDLTHLSPEDLREWLRINELIESSRSNRK